METNSSEEQRPTYLSYFFVNDLLLCVEASSPKHWLSKIVWRFFVEALAKKSAKTRQECCFQKNINHVRAKEINGKMEFKTIVDLGKYLGIPFHH